MAVGKRVRVFFCQVSATRIAKIFLASDLVCLLLQGAGGGLLAVGNETATSLGNAIVLAGLAVQITFFTAYLWIVLKLRFQHEFKLKHVLSLRPLFRGLFLTVGLMYVRNLYRIVEFASVAANSYSNPGYVPSNEWTFFVFESSPIFLAFVVYAWYPFNKYLGSNEERPRWRAELDEVTKRLFPDDSRADGGDDDDAVAAKSAAAAAEYKRPSSTPGSSQVGAGAGPVAEP